MTSVDVRWAPLLSGLDCDWSEKKAMFSFCFIGFASALEQGCSDSPCVMSSMLWTSLSVLQSISSHPLCLALNSSKLYSSLMALGLGYTASRSANTRSFFLVLALTTCSFARDECGCDCGAIEVVYTQSNAKKPSISPMIVNRWTMSIRAITYHIFKYHHLRASRFLSDFQGLTCPWPCFHCVLFFPILYCTNIVPTL
jgi:hypothetical protein